MRYRSFFTFIAALVLALTGILPAASIKDSESASHGDEAANYQLVKTYDLPGIAIRQYNLAVLSHYSYLLISEGQILVIDPGRDIEAYLAAAAEAKAKIVGIYLTHSHADFVAGHRELAQAAACPIHINSLSKAAYPHQALEDGSSITIGSAVLTVRRTPGHTPDGTCGLVATKADPLKPLAMFSGDTLFVGSVGRPDLLEDMTAAELASLGYDTWHKVLSKLPDAVTVLPAHGAGSLCGAHLRDEPFTTIGTERTSNPYLQHPSRGAYVAAVLDGLPEAPQYFGHNARLNRIGPPLIDWKAAPRDVKAVGMPARPQVIDLRDAKSYAAQHVHGALNIGLRGRFETWTGIMVPWGSAVLLCGTEDKEYSEAVRRLHRIGYQALSWNDWKASSTLASFQPITPQALHAVMQQPGDSPVVVDVRLPSEWMALRIGTVLNLPITHLDTLSAKLDRRQPVVAVCNSAYRSSLAVGVLERAGFTQATSLAGGGEAWMVAGLPVFEAARKGPASPAARVVVPLPDRIAAADLKRMLSDLPGTFDLIDLRPVSAFADFQLPGSRNLDIAELLSDPVYLTGAGPLVIVDRDGSLAMIAAGVLAQKTKRPIKALFGGLEAWWRESPFTPASGKSAPATPAAPVSSPAVTPAAPTPVPAAPKKKSAGC